MSTLNWIPWLISLIASPELNFVTQHVIPSQIHFPLAWGREINLHMKWQVLDSVNKEYIYSLFLRCVLWRCLQRRSVTEHELGYVSNVTHKLSSSYVRAVRLYFVGNELHLCGLLSMHLFISCSRGKWYSISHSPCTEAHFAQFTPVSPSHETFIRSIHSLCTLSWRTLEPTDFSLNSIRSVIFLKVSSPQHFLSPCFRRYQPSVRKHSSDNYCRSTKSVYRSILHFV